MKRNYIDFQDRSQPLAYLITIRTYGTWLHGDERGSMDRREYNRFGDPKIAPSGLRIERDRSLMKHPAFVLNAQARIAVEEAIREVCDHKNSRLFALNVRTNHVHITNSAVQKPEPMMNAFKSYATRKLKSYGLVAESGSVWARHGSTRYLWTEEHIAAAVDYVINGQGDDLPTFD